MMKQTLQERLRDIGPGEKPQHVMEWHHALNKLCKEAAAALDRLEALIEERRDHEDNCTKPHIDRLEAENARLRGAIESQRVDLGLLIGAVRAGDPNSELRVRVEDMERRTNTDSPEGKDAIERRAEEIYNAEEKPPGPPSPPFGSLSYHKSVWEPYRKQARAESNTPEDKADDQQT